MGMTSRQKRVFKRQWDSQIEQERNGAPVPGEIAALMTKPIEVQLWQVSVVRADNGQHQRVGPAMIEDAVRGFAAAINQQIALGREKTWREATAVPCIRANQPALIAA